MIRTAFLCSLFLLAAPEARAPHFFTAADYFTAQVAQCIEDHTDPVADLNTTCRTDSECERPEAYCFRAIASGCSDPDDYSYSDDCGGQL